MRSIVLAFLLLQLGWAWPAYAQSASPMAGMLPLFAKSNCASLKETAEQLFCGDPDLNALAPRLGAAVEARLSRIVDRRQAAEENVEWIESRNASCGVFGVQPIQPAAFPSVKACLLKATQERIAILADSNFDCLAANTTAGLVICADPELAVADKELNSQIVALIAKLKENEVKGALAEYARWTRTRDRICDLDDKDNVPLSELESSEPCLNDLIKQKLAEVTAARGDPKKLFGKDMLSPSPDADAVDLCVGRVHSANTCENFLRISRVLQLDVEASEREAIVTAAVEMKVLAPFSICSPIASTCTGTCWDLQARQPRASAANSRKTSRSAIASPSRNRSPSRRPRTAVGAAPPSHCGRSNTERRSAGRSRHFRQTCAWPRADVALRLGYHQRISFGEIRARRIFSFAFHIARFIDASLSRSLPSRQIR